MVGSSRRWGSSKSCSLCSPEQSLVHPALCWQEELGGTRKGCGCYSPVFTPGEPLQEGIFPPTTSLLYPVLCRKWRRPYTWQPELGTWMWPSTCCRTKPKPMPRPRWVLRTCVTVQLWEQPVLVSLLLPAQSPACQGLCNSRSRARASSAWQSKGLAQVCQNSFSASLTG